MFFKKYSAYLLATFSGMLYASGFPMFFGKSFFLGPIFSLIILFFLLNNELRLKRQLFLSLFYSLGFYLLGFYWIPHTLKEFGGIFFPLNYFLGLFFSIFIIPQIYLFIFFRKKFSNLILLSLIFVILEEIVPQQFPAHIGHSFISLVPHIKLNLAPIFGAPIYTFFSVLLALSIASHMSKKKIPYVEYLFLLIIFASNFINTTPNKSEFKRINVRIVQANIGNFLKIDSEKGSRNSIQSVFIKYEDLSISPASFKPNLIIWPETSFPTLLSTELLKNSQFSTTPNFLKEIINKTNAELFIGGYDFKSNINGSNFQDQYNAAFHFSNEGKHLNTYRKIRLIPFGEGLPFGPLNSILSKYITNISYFAEGKDFTLFKTANNIYFTTAICYEILFSNFIREYLNANPIQPDVLINLTNDSWYGNTAENEQHLFLAKWRALEFNIPIIRSTNTGISTFITSEATELKRLEFDRYSNLDLSLEIRKRDSTFYQKFGLLPILFLGAFYFFIDFIIKRKLRI